MEGSSVVAIFIEEVTLLLFASPLGHVLLSKHDLPVNMSADWEFQSVPATETIPRGVFSYGRCPETTNTLLREIYSASIWRLACLKTASAA